MLTQQEIVDRLNQLTIRNNLTWNDVKYDADKAISKINNFLGTKYPKMSTILTSPASTYAIGYIADDTYEGTMYEIFPEEHIHNVVIPFIASEVLAHDEEFTNIFNKYVADYQEGLFEMFQSEFNRVPLVFRQDPTQGVFFASDSVQSRIQHNQDADLPVFKFRIFYHINNDEIALNGVEFVSDYGAYLYEEIAVIKGWDTTFLSLDGTKAFHFLGWSRARDTVSSSIYSVGTEITMIADLHLYAVWDTRSTLTLTAGSVRIKDEYLASITNLVIPEYVNGFKVTTIPTAFIFGSKTTVPADPLTALCATLLQQIILPVSLRTIETSAFSYFKGNMIVIPPYEPAYIKANAFSYTPNLIEIILPKNVSQIDATPFTNETPKHLTIHCSMLEVNKPDTWVVGWEGASTTDYTVTVDWGYNG